MFGNLGMGEMIFIGVVLLLVFGARRLPEIGASMGKGIREFKKSINEVTNELNPQQPQQYVPPQQAPQQYVQPQQAPPQYVQAPQAAPQQQYVPPPQQPGQVPPTEPPQA
jgi:sec-independent protein translocase protein TatA